MKMYNNQFTIARFHFKDGTHYDVRVEHSNHPGCGQTVDDIMKEARDRGYVHIQKGLESERIPYHNVARVTSNFCETDTCPLCGTTGYVCPEEII
jgi:hypothetical protein